MFMSEEEIVVPDPVGWWGCWDDMRCRCNYCGFGGGQQVENVLGCGYCWDKSIFQQVFAGCG